MDNGIFTIPSPLQKIEDERFRRHGVEVYVKRDDLIHSQISGNKWRKLQLNVEKFRQGRYDKLVTFGGAFSNHIAAVAALGRLMQIPVIGIIRGDELNASSNETLSRAHADGMELRFVSREEYESRYERIYHEELRRELGNILIIEEGGANYHGVMGVAAVVREFPFEPDYVYTAIGTGTTAAGLLLAAENCSVIGVPVLKGGHFLEEEIRKLLLYATFDEELADDKMQRLKLATDFHFGGYGKITDDLIDFMNGFYREQGIGLDPVYTGKAFYAFYDHLEKGKISRGARVVLLHTGGLQGISAIAGRLRYPG